MIYSQNAHKMLGFGAENSIQISPTVGMDPVTLAIAASHQVPYAQEAAKARAGSQTSPLIRVC